MKHEDRLFFSGLEAYFDELLVLHQPCLLPMCSSCARSPVPGWRPGLGTTLPLIPATEFRGPQDPLGFDHPLVLTELTKTQQSDGTGFKQQKDTDENLSREGMPGVSPRETMGVVSTVPSLLGRRVLSSQRHCLTTLTWCRQPGTLPRASRISVWAPSPTLWLTSSPAPLVAD